jgi:imidazolonepropionase-like amidohydrolase
MRCLKIFICIAFSAWALGACSSGQAAEGATLRAFVGGRLIDGSGGTPLENSVIIVGDGRIQAVGELGSIEVPDGAEVINVSGHTIIPGLINTHGHVGDVKGLQAGQYSRENVLDQLDLYARYGITTVVSLGDDRQEGVQVRDEQGDSLLNRARLYVAGPVITVRTAEEAIQRVRELAQMKVNWAKIRVDDNLDASTKMTPEVYKAVIDEAHKNGLPVAVHMVELADAKAVVAAGADFLAHSVRDAAVDDELIGMLRERRICLTPTLTREISTFVYGSRPAFFDDPFFLKEADPAVLQQLQEPARQERMRANAGAQYWQAHLPLAMSNLKALADAGVRVPLGTDSGPAGRFQGYFEHLEMEMMVDAGLTPMQVLTAATSHAAGCMGLDSELGTVEPGKRADFVVLTANPLEDITNTRTIESVWINGNRVPD